MPPPVNPAVYVVRLHEDGGKSQMAAGLMRHIAVDSVHVGSAGTKPTAAINGLSAHGLLEIGVDITDPTPNQLTDNLFRAVDRVIVLGRDDIGRRVEQLARQLDDQPTGGT